MTALEDARRALLEATTARDEALAALHRRQQDGTDAAIRRAQDDYQRAREAVRLAREAVEVAMRREA